MGKILLIEDEVEVSEVTQELLEEAGHVVLQVYTVDEAEAALNSGFSFDLIITDLNVKGRNPLNLVLRNKTPFIINTGSYPNLPQFKIRNKPDFDRLVQDVTEIMDGDKDKESNSETKGKLSS